LVVLMGHRQVETMAELSSDQMQGAEIAQAAAAASRPPMKRVLDDFTDQNATRPTKRRRKMPSAATIAVNPEQNAPSLGALNRQLTMVMQQLTAAHQVIGPWLRSVTRFASILPNSRESPWRRFS
jgi:hypothetical protein